MNSSNLIVRQGEIVQVEGPSRSCRGVNLIAAQVHLWGTSFSPCNKLAAYLERREVPPALRVLMLDGNDTPWVRGRIERVFQIPPTTEEDRGEKSGLFASFAAVLSDDHGVLQAIPFICTDCYLETLLEFSEENGPASPVRDQIAEAFWELLLEDPSDIRDYRDSVLHTGGGFWLSFGVEDGSPFVEELDEM